VSAITLDRGVGVVGFERRKERTGEGYTTGNEERNLERM
jgi:hypothetical protein